MAPPSKTKDCFFIDYGCSIGLGNYLKTYITMLSIAESPSQMKIVTSNDMNNDYHNILDQRHVVTQDQLPGNASKFFNCGLMVLADEADQVNVPNEYNAHQCEFVPGHLRHLFLCKASIDLCHDASWISPRVYDRIMNVIRHELVLKEEIVDLANAFMSDKEDMLAISVRTWKARHEHDIRLPYDKHVYFQAIHETIHKFPNIRGAYLSCDNEKETEVYLQFMQEHFPVVHVYVKDRGSLTYLQYAMVKLLILSKCKYFICNRISTYAEMAFWYSGLSQHIVPVF